MVRIANVIPESIAEELRLEIGSRIVRINGAPVRDAIDYRFLEADALLELEIQPLSGEPVIYEIEKDPGEALGIVTEPDVVRQCANKCVFCFIDGNPAGARKALYLKDDDFRLSFTYGSYVTLTNLGPRGFRRLIEQRLSPLYVSVHATEPAVRQRLLGVELGGGIVEQLQELTDNGIEVHTQVVLCPEWNDGEHLARTIDDLWRLGPGVLSLSVVPVGLTQHNLNRPVRLLTPGEARAAIEQVEAARARSLRERGTGWAYVGDEMFFIAGMPIPEASYYDDWPLTENGVGAVRRLIDEFRRGVDTLPPLAERRIAIVTGTRMGPVLEPLAAELRQRTGARVDVLAVENRYFGATVNTAGLLAGRDIIAELEDGDAYDVVLTPAEALNDDAVYVDDVSHAQLEARFRGTRFVPAYELTSAFAEL